MGNMGVTLAKTLLFLITLSIYSIKFKTSYLKEKRAALNAFFAFKAYVLVFAL